MIVNLLASLFGIIISTMFIVMSHFYIASIFLIGFAITFGMCIYYLIPEQNLGVLTILTKQTQEVKHE